MDGPDDDAVLEQLLSEIGSESVTDDLLDRLGGWDPDRRDEQFFEELTDKEGMAEVRFFILPPFSSTLSRPWPALMRCHRRLPTSMLGGCSGCQG